MLTVASDPVQPLLTGGQPIDIEAGIIDAGEEGEFGHGVFSMYFFVCGRWPVLSE